MYIGIDLGGTNIAAGLFDADGTLRVKDTSKTLPERGAAAVVDDIGLLCRRVCETAGADTSSVEWIGVGTPGSIDRAKGVVIYANNLNFDHVPMRTLLQKTWPDTAIHIENDANAAALGEVYAGAAKGRSSAVCVTLGTGVGGGIVQDGKVFVGYNGAAGEVGHHVIVMDGEACTCGRLGCWESYASATGLIRQTRAAMERHPDSKLWELERERGKVNGRTAFDAMRLGDAAGRAVVEQYLRYVAAGISNLINILQPEVLCIGGGIAGEGPWLLERLEKLVAPDIYYCDGTTTQLLLATLGNDAGVIGAAMLGR